MNLINKKVLARKIHNAEFPTGIKRLKSIQLIENWQKALKDSDLEKTKEKSVQGKFLSTFFEVILGYSDVTTGQDEWTLIQHPRIENNNTEPDGSLGWFSKSKKITRAVIELKDATTLLDKRQTINYKRLTPVEQAYLYATKYEGCNWIIVSNYKEIRLYNKGRTQEYYEKFNILDLNKEEEFNRFYYLLCQSNLIDKQSESQTDMLVNDSSAIEQDITKKFYLEYKTIRIKLLEHLIENNQGVDKQTLLEKAQKILDRLVFILVCEDSNSLLPANSVIRTYERAVSSFSNSETRVWDEFKGLFSSVDEGNEKVIPPINRYNGGLFAKDDELNNLKLLDELWANLVKLAEYDFETDLNVNILGHIFEQSISDLEHLKLELSEGVNKESESKRKKDGIYYTPEYITDYIVKNTIGRYLEENPSSLESIKILDPACGSGAFLNKAHAFLLQEHRTRYEEIVSSKTSGSFFDESGNIAEEFRLASSNKSVLLNNLFGVDLNEESVEITKLSLWLKTANQQEPLQNLDKNIKCGNSLIDDEEIVGDKAFDWANGFEDIMKNGGFDIVIGNPPYISNKQMFRNNQINEKGWLDKNYLSTKSGNYDLYIPFIERGIQLLKPGGYLSFIIPNKFLIAKYSKELLKIISEKYTLVEVADFSNLNVFEDVSVYPIIITIKKTSGNKVFVPRRYIEDYSIQPTKEQLWNFIDQKPIYANENGISGVIEKIEQVKNCNAELSFQPGINGFQFTNYGKCIHEGKNNESDKRILVTGSIDPYTVLQIPTRYKGIDYQLPYISYDKNLISESKWELFSSKKIIIAGMAKRIEAVLDLKGQFAPAVSVYSILSDSVDLRYIAGILNSDLINWYFNARFSDKHLAGGYLSFNNLLLKQIPVVKGNSKLLCELVERLSVLKPTFINKLTLMNQLLTEDYGIVAGKSKMKHILELGWNGLLDILKKNKVNLDINQKEKLFEWYKAKQKDLLEIDAQIKEAQNQINDAVYKLYNLTEEEIRLIKGAQ